MTTQELQRRTVLRGLLAAGCALCLPVGAGCERSPSPGANAPPPDAGGGQTPSAMPPGTGVRPGETGESAVAKLSQAAAEYQNQPKGDQSCDKCMHFISESGTCKVVEGQVSPQGWCKLWAKKPG